MGYAHPEVLVSTAWVDERRGEGNLRMIEVDLDPSSYFEGHVPGAVGWDWHIDLCDVVQRDVLPADRYERLMSRSGITPETEIVLYGDSNNLLAAWAFWQLKLYGHERVRLMDGGRGKWLSEARVLTRQIPTLGPTRHGHADLDPTFRAMLDDVRAAAEAGHVNLVDVRSPAEYSGDILAPPGLPETCQRGGHIPGAVCVPWGRACREDGTFKPEPDLRRLYADAGVDPARSTIVYARIGERASHTWLVLAFLLGLRDVRNYDGSWTEWGNLVRAPIER